MLGISISDQVQVTVAVFICINISYISYLYLFRADKLYIFNQIGILVHPVL